MKSFYVNLYQSMSGHAVARGPLYAQKEEAESDVYPREKAYYLGTFRVEASETDFTVNGQGLLVPNRGQC